MGHREFLAAVRRRGRSRFKLGGARRVCRCSSGELGRGCRRRRCRQTCAGADGRLPRGRWGVVLGRRCGRWWRRHGLGLRRGCSCRCVWVALGVPGSGSSREGRTRHDRSGESCSISGSPQLGQAHVGWATARPKDTAAQPSRLHAREGPCKSFLGWQRRRLRLRLLRRVPRWVGLGFAMSAHLDPREARHAEIAGWGAAALGSGTPSRSTRRISLLIARIDASASARSWAPVRSMR
jgi:hypothetical protein